MILCHSATELAVDRVLRSLAAEQGDVGKLAQAYRGRRANLHDKGVRLAFAALTGSHTADWWPEFCAHVPRRHSAAHSGETIAGEEAEQSVEVCAAVVRYVHSAWFNAAPPD